MSGSTLSDGGFVRRVASGAASKVDTVVLKNGNRLTGEVKKLVLGRLEYSTDSASTIKLKWDHVAQVASDLYFEVLSDTGQRYFGALLLPEKEGLLRVGLGTFFDDIPLERVAQIERLRRSFWKRIKGNIDVGVSLTSANSRFDFDIKADAHYRTPKWRVQAGIEKLTRRQDNAEDLDRASLTSSYERFLSGRWLLSGIGAAESNSESPSTAACSASSGVVPIWSGLSSRI